MNDASTFENREEDKEDFETGKGISSLNSEERARIASKDNIGLTSSASLNLYNMGYIKENSLVKAPANETEECKQALNESGSSDEDHPVLIKLDIYEEMPTNENKQCLLVIPSKRRTKSIIEAGKKVTYRDHAFSYSL